MIAAAFVWSTCEVGLGESIDNDAPTVTVTGPAKASVCSDAVNIIGTCGDDKGVKSVNITVRNTNTGATYNYEGTVDTASKSATGLYNWGTTINQKDPATGKYPLPDGKYVADVVVTDVNNRKSGVSSTAFDIDNTAPIFCVTSPASLNVLNPRKYGRSVTISGEIADDHDIDHMSIRVFTTDANGNNPVEITSALPKTQFRDFETAGGTTVYVAKFFETEPAQMNPDGTENPDYGLYKNYMAMYGNTALGQDVYLRVFPTLVDIAGNTSSACYLSSDMKDLAAKLCGVEKTIDSLQTANLMKIYNGTYTLEELNDEQKQKIVSLLNGTYQLQPGDDAYYSCYVDEQSEKQKPLVATVNSNNRPMYAFSGYELDLANIQWSEINTGGTLSISVQAGLDDWGVLPSKLKVWLYKCDDTATEYPEGNPNRKVFESDVSEGFTITNALGESISGISTSVSAQSYYVTLPKISSDEKYLLVATGVDEDGNSLCPIVEKYGFRVASTGAVPKVDLNDRYYIKGTDVLTTGGTASVTIKITDGTDTINNGETGNYLKVTRQLYSGHISSKGYLGNYESAKIGGAEEDIYRTEISQLGTNDYSLTAPICKYSNLAIGNYTLALIIEAKNSAASSDATYIVWIDNKKPEITIEAPADNDEIYDNNANIKENPEGSGKYYYTPYGKWSDKDGAGTSSLWYTLTDIGSAAPTISGSAESGWTITGNPDGAGGNYKWIKLEAITGETEISWSTNWGGLDDSGNKTPAVESTGNFIKMIAVDAVGNISEVVKREGITFDFGKPTSILDSEPTGTTPAKAQTYYNSYSNKVSGKFEFKLKATDTLALADSDSITVTAKKYNKTTGTYDTIPSGNSGYTLENVVLAADKKSAERLIKISADGTSDGMWTFVAKATDACGRDGAEISFATTVDCLPPALTPYDSSVSPAQGIGIKGSGTTDDWYKDDTLNISGRFTESDSGSGIDKIYWWLGTPSMQKNAATNAYVVPEDLTIEGNYSGYTALPSGSNTGTDVLYSIAPQNFEEIIVDETTTTPTTYYNNLYIQTIDKAGNKSARIGPYQIKEDINEPAFEAKYYTYNGANFSPASGKAVSNKKKDMTIYGLVSDKLSGVASLTFTMGTAALTDGVTITYTTAEIADNADGATFAGKTYDSYGNITDKTAITAWKAVIAYSKLATASLYAKAADTAGNATSSHKLFDIDVDQDSPTISLTTPETKLYASAYVQDGESKSASDNKTPKAVNGKMSINGTATDNNLQSVSVYVGTDMTAAIVSGDKKLIELSDTSMYNWSVDNEFSYVNNGKFYFSDGSPYTGSGKDIYIKVKAIDSAANETINVYQYSVDPKSDRPVIKLFKELNDMTSADEKYKWVIGDSSISGSIEDDDGVEKLEATYQIYDPKTDTWSADTAGTVALENGSFSVTGPKVEDPKTGKLKVKDGKQIITFKVTDKAGTVFTAHAKTTDEDKKSFLAPIIYGNDKDINPAVNTEYYGQGSGDDSLVYIKFDNTWPQMRDVKFAIYEPGATWPPEEDDYQDTLKTVGGDRQKFNIQFYAGDANGIKSVTLTLKGEEKDADGNVIKTVEQVITGDVETTTTQSDGYLLCAIENIQINTTGTTGKIYPSGTWPAKIVIADNAGLETTSTYNVTVDNDAPKIKILYPKASSGSVFGDVTPNGEVDKSSLSYGLSKNTSDEPTVWKDIESSLSWEIHFDGDTTAKNHDVLLKDWMVGKVPGVTPDTIKDGTAPTTTIYLWMKAVDEVGNVSQEKFPITVDPCGDKPNVQIDSPSDNGTTVGGRIRVYGSATDDKEAKAVFVQIISGYHDTSVQASGTYGSFDYDDETKALSNFSLTADDLNYLSKVKDSVGNYVYEIYKMDTYDPDDSSIWTKWTGASGQEAKDYGVLASLNGGKSWFKNINVNGEFADANSTNSLAMRVYAIDAVTKDSSGSITKTANVSQPALRQMTFDADAPTTTIPNVRKYKGTVTSAANYESTTPYAEKMYVSGETWLSFRLHDASNIGQIQVGVSSVSQTKARERVEIDLPTDQSADKKTAKDGVEVICSSPAKNPEEKNTDGTYKDAALNEFVNVLVKLNTAETAVGVGTQYVSVNFADTNTTPTSTSVDYVINYDNKRPEIASVTDSAYIIDPNVCQSNGWYNFNSKVTEAAVNNVSQSGYERVAFYFVRRDTITTGTPTYIYDVMVKRKDAEGNDQNKITLPKNSAMESSEFVYSEGLYWIKKTVTRTSTNNTVTLASDDARIHPYGLAKIRGTIYKITSVNGTSVMVDGQPEGIEGDSDVAYFAIANVVDHKIAETSTGSDTSATGYGYGYNRPSGDDGDLMVESVKEIGGNSTWGASVYSKNIPDGPIELHYVAFDKAGNCVKGIMGCKDFATYKTYDTADAVDAAKATPETPVSVYAFEMNKSSKYYKQKEVAAYVSNNAPRLSNIFAGTDLDGDNKINEPSGSSNYNEIVAQVYTSSLTDWENSKPALILGTAPEDNKPAKAAFTAKGMTVIRPEIIGGNGDLYYSYKISGEESDSAGATTPYTIEGKNTAVFMAGDTGAATEKQTNPDGTEVIVKGSREDQVKSATADIFLQVGDFKNLARKTGTGKGIADCGESNPVVLELTFWDSTEVTKVFENSQTAKATVYMAVALGDNDAPSAGIAPIYWKSLTDNSIYESDKASTYDDLKGHIELPTDLPAAFTETGSQYTDPKNADYTYPAKEMDKDPKLSGIVVLTGTVSDTKMLSKILMSITNGTDSMNASFDQVKVADVPVAVAAYPLAMYSNAKWTVKDGLANYGIKFSVKDKGISPSGHSAEWTMVWDTGFVSGIAATDLAVRVYASDQTADAGIGSDCVGIGGTAYEKPKYTDKNYSAESTYKVDVVPYITSLETTMTERGVAYGRTSSGRYPVYFYKNSTTTQTMASGDTESHKLKKAMTIDGVAKAAGTVIQGFIVHGFNLEATVEGNKVRAAAVSRTVGESGNITKSGVYAINVNGVYTLNNINKDDAKGDYPNEKGVTPDNWITKRTNDVYAAWKNFYNRQPSKENNLLLTDDVALDVWQINNKAAVPVRGIANDVTMKINEKSKMLNFAFVNGPLNFAMADGINNSYQTWARSYDFCKSATLALDAGGNAYGTIAGGDTGDYYADAFGFYSSKWGTGYLNNSESNDNATHGTQRMTQGQRRLESVGQKGTKDDLEKTDWNYNTNTDCQTDQWRIVSPCIATTYSGTATNAYLAYYDEMNDEIRFRAGTSVPASASDFGNFIDRFYYGNKPGTNGTKHAWDRPYSHYYYDVQIMANADSGSKPGPYVSIAASNKTGSDVVVMVWHDPVKRCMWYSYNADPTKLRGGSVNNQSGSGQGWSKPVTIFTNVTGEYCQVAFDKEGHVHIAAYNSNGNDLWYAYLSGYNNNADGFKKKTCVVDSNGAIGKQITLDVAYSAGTSGKPVPYIGYLAEGKTLPKLAYYTGSDITSDTTSESDMKGASGNYFTNKWEISAVPTVTAGIQGVKDYDRINVGVWKSAGVLTDSTPASTYGSVDGSFYKNTGNVGDTTSYGKCFGNGTSNPAMAYRYENGQDGFVEMAQKK